MITSKTSTLALALILSFSATFINTQAHAFKFSKKICKEYNLGTSWYCEDENQKKETKKTKEDLTTADEIMNRDVAPEQKAVLLNQLWETQQKRAVITGKKEDLENVLITQRFIAKLGTDFAKKMVRLTQTNPTFSQTESYYKNVSEEALEDAKKAQLFKEAKRRYAIAFIYSSNCPYCKRQLPILLSLKEVTGMTVLGISADGGAYEGLDQNIIDPSVVTDSNIQAFPTIMLLDSKTERRIFIAKGLTTEDQLETLIFKTIIEIENENRNKK